MTPALILLLAAAPPVLSVGFAEVDVTPKLGGKPVFLAGFGQDRRATAVHDPIMVRAVVLSDGTQKIAFASADVVGLFRDSVEKVREQCPGFKFILVNSTHNHEGPDTMGLWGPNPFASGVDQDYLKRVEDGAAEAIRKAAATLTPAAAELGTAAGPELLHDARDPQVKHDELTAIKFTAGGKAVGVVVNWHCHPETLDSRNTQVSADFVAGTVAALKAKHGCPVAYFSGTVGGLMTSLHVPVKDAAGNELKDGTFEKTTAYGERVAALADKALSTAKPVSLTPFEVRTVEFLMPVENTLYKLAWQVGKLKRDMYAWDNDPTPAKFTTTKDATKPVAVRTEMSIVRLGDVQIAAIPGEIYPELVLGKVADPAEPNADFPTAAVEPAVYPQLMAKHRMLFGLANDELGYFIPKRQWDAAKPYCYGRKTAPYGEINSVGPDAAPILCDQFKKLAAGK